jgi:lipoprotein-anchoring transpeptidase ErfK/SrfK
MNNRFDEARLSVEKAREALRQGNRTEARQWAEHAAALAPQMEDPWLILAAVASPRASVEYIQTALKINPNSLRAHKGMEWAQQRLRENPEPEPLQLLPRAEKIDKEKEAGAAPTIIAPSRSKGQERSAEKPKSKRNQWLAVVLLALGCIICVAVIGFAISSPVLASLMNNPAPAVSHPQVWAKMNIPKPTYTPLSVAEVQATPTPQLLLPPTIEPTETLASPTDTPMPMEIATQTLMPLQDFGLPTDTPMPNEQNTEAPMPTPTSSGSISMSIVPDTPTAAASTTSAPQPATGSKLATEIPPQVANNGERWVDVNLTQQMTYAYQGNTLVNSFLVSTGTWQYPTVTGQYHIYVKLRYTDMTGPGYYLPNVPYTMYFYEGYGLHGTYWHHNFGTPMSHGCVNLSIPDAEWLYNWASVGTLVNVHY